MHAPPRPPAPRGSFASSAYAASLLAPAPTADGAATLDLSLFVERSVPHAQLIADAVRSRGAELATLVGLGGSALSFAFAADAIGAASGLKSLSLAPLPTSTQPGTAARRNAAPEWRALAEIISPMKPTPSREERLEELFTAMDVDGDGTVDFEEYKAMVKSPIMLQFFTFMDAHFGNSDGKLGLDEWLDGMSALGTTMSDEQYERQLVEMMSEVQMATGVVATGLVSLTTGAQALVPSEAAALALAVAESASLTSLDLSGLRHLELAAEQPPLPTAASYGAAPPLSLEALDKPDEARSAALGSALSPLFGAVALSTLTLSRCGLGDAALVLLGAAAARSKSLASLDVSYNPFGEQGALALGDLLKASASLRTFDCSGGAPSRTSPLALTALTEGLGASALTTMTWRVEKAEAKIVKPGARLPREKKKAVGPRSQWALQLSKALSANKSLASFDLGGHALGSLLWGPLPADAPATTREARIGASLGASLRSHWALTSLCLDGAMLHDGALALVLAPLTDHPALATLDLSTSVFGRQAGRALAAMLRQSRTLASLKLVGCDLHSEPFVLVLEALLLNATLGALDVSLNPLGESDGLVEEEKPVEAEGEEGEAESKDAPPAEGEGEEAEAPAEPKAPPLPAVAVCLALSKVFESNRALKELVLRGCCLEQPVPPEPEPEPEPEAAAPADEAADEAAETKEGVLAAALGEEADGEGAGEEGAEAAAEVEPPKLPVLGAVMGAGLSLALGSALAKLDLRDNGLGDEGVTSFAGGLGGAKSLEVLFLAGCCSAAAHAAVAEGIAASGRVVMCDLSTTVEEASAAAAAPRMSREERLEELFTAMDVDGDGTVDFEEYKAMVKSPIMLQFFTFMDAHFGNSDGKLGLDEWLDGMSALGANWSDEDYEAELKKAMDGVKAATGHDAAEHGPAETPIQIALSSNRYEHALLWEGLLESFPPSAASALAAAFCGLPGASSLAAPLGEVLARLLPAAEVALLAKAPADAPIPWGGFVQWVADCFSGTLLDGGLDASAFAALLAVLAAPLPLGASSVQDALPGVSATSCAALALAAARLVTQTRRYTTPPKLKPRPPPEAEALGAAALEALGSIVGTLTAAEAAKAATRADKLQGIYGRISAEATEAYKATLPVPEPIPEPEDDDEEQEPPEPPPRDVKLAVLEDAAEQSFDDFAAAMAEREGAMEGDEYDALLAELIEVLRKPEDPPAGSDAESLMAGLLAFDSLVAAVPEKPEELLHPTLPPDLFMTQVSAAARAARRAQIPLVAAPKCPASPRPRCPASPRPNAPPRASKLPLPWPPSERRAPHPRPTFCDAGGRRARAHLPRRALRRPPPRRRQRAARDHPARPRALLLQRLGLLPA